MAKFVEVFGDPWAAVLDLAIITTGVVLVVGMVLDACVRAYRLKRIVDM